MSSLTRRDNRHDSLQKKCWGEENVWWPWTRAEPGQFLRDTDNVLAREIKTCVDHSNKERQQYEWFVLPEFGGGKVAELSSELRVHLTSYCLERSPLKEATYQGKATPAEWDCPSTILSKSWENSCRSLTREWISHTERQCSARIPKGISEEHTKVSQKERANSQLSATWKVPQPNFIPTHWVQQCLKLSSHPACPSTGGAGSG